MFQQVNSQVTLGEIVPWIATVLSVAFNWRMAAIVSNAKLEINNEGKLIRQELANAIEKLEVKFVPAQAADLQRTNLERRVEKLEDEITRNRERHHEISGKFTELIMGPIQKINDQLTDKARRMSAYEERERARDAQFRDVEDAIQELQVREK